MGQRGASLDDISAALNKQQAAEKRQGTAVTDGAYEAYLYVQRSVNSRVNHHLSLTQAMKRTWDDFNKLRSGVSADPVQVRLLSRKRPATTQPRYTRIA